MTTSGKTGGIGILGLLGVAFVVLKLTGYITWSWWWVTAPFWGGFALAVVIFCVILAVMSVRMLFKELLAKSK